MGVFSSKEQDPIEVPRNKLTTVLPGEERIHASTWFEDPTQYLDHSDGARTVWEVFERGLNKVSGKGPCVGTRKSTKSGYEWQTYEQIQQRSKAFGSGLLSKGITNGHVGIRCKNRPEWVVTALSCSYYTKTICTIGTTTNRETTKAIINQGEFKVFIADSEDASWILENHKDMKSIQLLVVLDLKESKESISKNKDKGIEVIGFRELEEYGSNNMKTVTPATTNDSFCVCYTSGTTGDPKGVELTHRTWASALGAMMARYPIGLDDVCHISYLPVAHVFEIGCVLCALNSGGKIGFYSGDIRELLNDMMALQPTYFPVVPRLLNRLHMEVMNEVNGSYIKKSILNLALSSKSYAIKNGTAASTIWETLIFSKIKQKLGGNVKIVLVASAPVSHEVKDFIKCALDCVFFEAYGQTETTVITRTDPDEWDSLHVGFPLPNCHIKVVDVPEMNYFAKDDVGEICVRGPCLMKGYFKRDDLTAEVIDKDGWLHTGDIGQWLPNGGLKIIDRKKNIFKLSQGEYIAPEKVENAYSSCDLLNQIFVDGLSTENYCVAIVVPNCTSFMKWAQSNGYYETYEELCDNSTIINLFIKELHTFGKAAGLNSLEQVKKIKLSSKPFSLEDGFLTATLKNKRPALRKYFQNEVKLLYERENSS